MSGDERLEQVIAFLGSQLPAPVAQESSGDGWMIFTGGSPAEVVVHLGETTVIVSEYSGVWETPDRFVVKPRRVGTVKWRRLQETAIMNVLSALIKGARELRLARYRPCTICGKRNPPETLFADDICPWCSDQSPTVVH